MDAEEKEMKEKYIAAEIEIIEFAVEDVITTSGTNFLSEDELEILGIDL